MERSTLSVIALSLSRPQGHNQTTHTMKKKTIAELWLAAVIIDTVILTALVVIAGLMLSK